MVGWEVSISLSTRQNVVLKLLFGQADKDLTSFCVGVNEPLCQPSLSALVANRVKSLSNLAESDSYIPTYVYKYIHAYIVWSSG